MNNLESEIAELQKMIETKRDQLEKAGGIIEEKDLVRESINEIFLDSSAPKFGTQNASSQVSSTITSAQSSDSDASLGASYLDNLDPQTAEIISNLIAEISTKGITPVINEVAKKEPFVIDAFHDALVDRLYDELKQRGLVK